MQLFCESLKWLLQTLVLKHVIKTKRVKIRDANVEPFRARLDYEHYLKL